MQTLRRARFLASLVLVWFALSIGAAIASPLVRPQSMELICSGSGAMKLLVKTSEGGTAPAPHSLECPLCASLGAPPPAAPATGCGPAVSSPSLQASVPECFAARTAAPPPGRGPPDASNLQ